MIRSSRRPRDAPDYVRAEIERSQARSMVMSLRGVVAAEHPLASQAGAVVLGRGGHAADAAIAANAVMGVVAPMMNGVGGDLFAIVYDAGSGPIEGVNASGWAPAGWTIERLRASGLTSMPQTGIHAVTVPGAVAGWSWLRDRFGRQSFAEILACAIDLAEHGFPVSEIFATEWASAEPLLQSEPESARTFLVGGRAPRAGEIFRNPDLARTLRQIAAGGAEAFYRGDPARRILACSERRGGAMVREDLADYSAQAVTPLSTAYREWNVYELPPNTQGIAALMMLNILERFPLREFGHQSADALHVMIEAKKLAYADMIRYVGDPAFTDIPVTELLSEAHAAARARLIDPARANPDVPAAQVEDLCGDTTYVSVVDRDGNMVSLIQSNFASFGSGLVPAGAGFVLQNRGGLFTLDSGHPNALAPRKRPLHTIIPGFMHRGDQRVAFGIMGGWNQAQAHAQFVSNVVDHGINIQASLEAARFSKLTFTGCDVILEARVPAATRAALALKGHEILLQGDFSSLVGGGQSVMRNAAAGVNFGASDPRRDGAAIPEPFLY